VESKSKGKSKAVDAGGNDAGGDVHPEYKVAEVKSAEAMKKKGFHLCELECGSTTMMIVTTHANVEAGQKVIVAAEGCTVQGKVLKNGKISGEFNEGVICSAKDMGWEGDDSSAIVLKASYVSGKPAPMDPRAGGGSAAKAAALEEVDIELSDDDKKGKKKKGGEAPKAKAKSKVGKDDEDNEDEDGEAPKAKAKAKARRAKKGDEEEEPVSKGKAKDDDDDDWQNEKKGKKKGKR